MRCVVREWLLGVCKIFAGRHDEPLTIDKPAPLACFIDRDAFCDHDIAEEICNASSGRARSKEQERLLRKMLVLHAKRSKNSRHANSCSALNVVVERRDAIAITLEDRTRIWIREVFPLNAAVREHGLDSRDELFDECIILFTGQSLLANTDVEWIVEKLFVIRANIEHDREREMWRNTGACGVERELSNRNAHTLRAKVTQTKNALAISNADPAYVRLWPIAHHIDHTTAMTCADEESFRTTIDASKRLTCQTNGRGVHHRHVRNRVAHQDVVEQTFVTFLEIAEVHVTINVCWQRADMAFNTLNLHVERRDNIREQAAQPILLTLFACECRTLVVSRIPEHVQAALRCFIMY